MNDVFDQHGMPLMTGQRTSAPGLYFCGQITVPTGQLREIGIEAQRIAQSAREYLRKETPHGFVVRRLARFISPVGQMMVGHACNPALPTRLSQIPRPNPAR